MKTLILIFPLLAVCFGINITITKFEAYPWQPHGKHGTVTKAGIFNETTPVTEFEEGDNIKFKCLADRPWKKCWIYKEFETKDEDNNTITEKLGCKSTHHAGYQVDIRIQNLFGLCLILNFYRLNPTVTMELNGVDLTGFVQSLC